MKVCIRKFEEKDISNKIVWINDERNNQFLHYEIPLKYEKTLEWFKRIENSESRYDGVIEADGKPVGLIGLLEIDRKNSKAEFYISMGEHEYQGKGIASAASRKLLFYGFYIQKLNRIYLYTEKENVKAQRLFEKIGFKKEGLIKEDLFSKGKYVDRYIYGITREMYDQFYLEQITPLSEIQKMDIDPGQNRIYIKRDDLIPISFGGNKARKAINFFKEIDHGVFDCVVTYGSSSSNHCRIVSNMAASRNLPCYIISPQEKFEETFNSQMMKLFGAEITVVPVNSVHETINSTLLKLREDGKTPYFIAGGGHGNLGTQAYVDCYEEIRRYEQDNHIFFDYIFFASGTGTTQAGLVCGRLLHEDDRKIIGISIARKNPRGRQVVIDSIEDYLQEKEIAINREIIEDACIFIDCYTDSGYGQTNVGIQETIDEMMIYHGIPMDPTYTGKAFTGMKKYIEEKSISEKSILFIHTGGTPLFFDCLMRK